MLGQSLGLQPSGGLWHHQPRSWLQKPQRTACCLVPYVLTSDRPRQEQSQPSGTWRSVNKARYAAGCLHWLTAMTPLPLGWRCRQRGRLQRCRCGIVGIFKQQVRLVCTRVRKWGSAGL